jgi:hypothetical protein
MTALADEGGGVTHRAAVSWPFLMRSIPTRAARDDELT